MKKIRAMQKLATILGFRGMKSFGEMYKGGTPTAFGHPENSMPTFWIHFSKENKVKYIEINSTYFRPTKQILGANSFILNSPKPISEIIDFIKQNPKL